MNALRQIGFFADNSVLDKNLLESEEIVHFEKFNGLFSCDSNFTIPFETGVKSVMIIGSTGSGKTASVILPMIKNCIKENMGGVILDVKGNLRAKVRAIADSYGRIDDIVEFGASETACKTNIIGAMEDYIVTDLFKTLCSYGMSRDGNGQFFYMSGAKICSDVYKCLNMLSESKKENKFLKQFTPTLYKIYQVISDRQMASGIWTLFMMEYERRKKYNSDLSNWQTLINDVKSNRFHLFKDAESYKNTDSSYEEQMAWNLNNMIRIFANIDQTHNILKNFSYEGEDSVDADFDKLVYKENKVVLIHFPIDCGMVGDILSKTIKEMYYTSVIKNGLNNKNITFMIADEFQDIIDIDENKKENDARFLSISREYRNINIFATQSVSALKFKNDHDGVFALLNNCMTKIFLQCTDVATMEWQTKIFHNISFCDSLDRGECLIDTFDVDNNRIVRFEKVNNEFNEVHKIKILLNCRKEENNKIANIQNNGNVGFTEQINELLHTNPNKNFLQKDIFDEYDIEEIRESETSFSDYNMFIYKNFVILRFIAFLGKNFGDNDVYEKYKKRYVAKLRSIRCGLFGELDY